MLSSITIGGFALWRVVLVGIGVLIALGIMAKPLLAMLGETLEGGDDGGMVPSKPERKRRRGSDERAPAGVVGYLADLKDQCPDAPDSFLLSQAMDGATSSQAKTAWIACLLKKQDGKGAPDAK